MQDLQVEIRRWHYIRNAVNMNGLPIAIKIKIIVSTIKITAHYKQLALKQELNKRTLSSLDLPIFNIPTTVSMNGQLNQFEFIGFVGRTTSQLRGCEGDATA